MLSSLVRIGIVGAIVAAGACSSSASTDSGCSPEALRPAIIVEAIAASGPVLTGTTTGAVIDGQYVDSLRPFQVGVGSIQQLGAAVNRPGTYNVVVLHAGYEPWEKDSVVVQGTACGIKNSVELVAALQPAP